jgi:glucose-1-phosphate adenylyltransferase
MMGWTSYFDNPELGRYISILHPQMRAGDTWYQGTADAIFQNIYTLERERPKRVLILSGDHIYKMNYAEMIRYHVEREATLTIATVPIKIDEARHFGVAVIDPQTRITGFQEKPRINPATIPGDPQHCLGSMGIYVFDTDELVRRVAKDSRQDSAHDFGKNIIPEMIAESAPVYAYAFKDENKKQAAYWRDVGTLDAFYEANIDLISVDPLCNLYDEAWPIRTYRKQYPPAKFVFADERGGRCGRAIDSLVASGVIVSGGQVFRSILSPRVRVNSYALVEDSIVMDGVNIGRHCKIRRAIVDKGVQIPEGMEIGWDPDLDRKRFPVTGNGIVVIPKEMRLQ